MKNPPPDKLKIEAFAKINLFLEVLGKRPDGYHDIYTVMQEISLADEIELSPSDEISLDCDDARIPSDSRNLIWRAAEALRAEAGIGRGVAVSLHKRIPHGAGLGGGSSDAAAAIIGLNRLWRLDWRIERLLPVAARVGSDVPFFLYGGTCVCEGRGERVTPIDAGEPLWFVLVSPPFAVSTAEIYSRVDSDLTNEPVRCNVKEIAVFGSSGAARVAGMLFNRLEAVACRAEPGIVVVIDALRKGGALGAMMTGSGSSVFGVCEDSRHARKVASLVEGMGVGQVNVVQSRPRRACCRAGDSIGEN
ncbi:MAG TPA: 4-(cytidine 5'-diphospho)-2-C-methyl-D-erythritol kinase [Candidatus Brocadiia bacterium]|nr:4-(cytidine 5'-diphospho)-2-C-methyl-D-erythritol kinase [Candidatus Brocadiia bacterium]